MNVGERIRLLRERATSARSGFTLIELLVALTLFGLLSVALLGGLRFGTRVWETGHERSEGFAEVLAAHGFLRNRLAQIRFPAQARTSRKEDMAFQGFSERAVFIAPLPDYIGLGGLYRFELAEVAENDRRDLVLTWMLYRPDRADWDDEELTSRRVLLEGIEALQIRYYGALEPDEDPDWHETWEDGDQLPRLIDLNLGFPEGDERAWPDLVVAPLIVER